MEQWVVDHILGYVATYKEVKEVLGKLKGGKAAGSSGIFPRMLKAGRKSEEVVDMLTDVVGNVWEEKSTPQQWVDAILVPIPK